jgi:hypothetical protein
MRAVTEAEFDEWKAHPVTRAVMEILGRRREEMRLAWEGGSFTDYDERAMALTNVGNIGTCKGYAFVQELDYEQYMGEIDDREQVRISPPGSSGVD